METRKQRKWAPHVPSTPIRCASSVDPPYLGRLVDVRVGLCPLPGWLLTKQKPYFIFFVQAYPGEAHKSNPVHLPPAISTLKGPPMKPSQAPSASSSCRSFVVVRNKGPKSKIPVSAGFLAVQGRLLSGKLTQKSPEIRFFHEADASQRCALACI